MNLRLMFVLPDEPAPQEDYGMSKENGGQAFPFGQTDELSGQLVNGWGSEGMTLRDYFAAKAMQAQLTYGKCRDMTPPGIADYAYEFADAMLAERSK